jgi:hypothetical protein
MEIPTAILPNSVQEKAQVQGESGPLVAETIASYGIESDTSIGNISS